MMPLQKAHEAIENNGVGATTFFQGHSDDLDGRNHTSEGESAGFGRFHLVQKLENVGQMIRKF